MIFGDTRHINEVLLCLESYSRDIFLGGCVNLICTFKATDLHFTREKTLSQIDDRC